MDRKRMEYCLERVEAYRASGQRSQEWALANGVKPRELASWCSHAQRWKAALDGTPVAPTKHQGPTGFISAKLPMVGTSGTVRIELQAGPSCLQLHWPLSNMAELAVLLREVGR